MRAQIREAIQKCFETNVQAQPGTPLTWRVGVGQEGLPAGLLNGPPFASAVTRHLCDVNIEVKARVAGQTGLL